MPIATRLTNAGTLLVNGSFDENTSITPAKFRTTSNTVYAGTLDEFTGAPVVDSSLKLWLDAAQITSYPGTGSTWTDLSGNGNNGTLVNAPTFISTDGGGCIQLDGSNDHITLPVTGFAPASLTIDYWIKRISDNGYFWLIDNSDQPELRMIFQSSGKLQIYFYDDGAYFSTALSNTTFSTASWYNITVTITNGLQNVYINGNQEIITTTGIYTGGPSGNAGEHTLGTYNRPGVGYGGYANVRIGGYRFYNRVLTAGEILQNYNALQSRYGLASITATQMPVVQRQQSSGTLLVNGEFDEFTGAPIVDSSLKLWLDSAQTTSYPGSGTTWTDLSGNGNNGTLVNSPTYSTGNGGYFSFGSGGTQRTSFTYQTPQQTASTAFTWNIWVYPVANSDSYVLMGYRGTTPLKFYKLTTQKFEMYPAEIFYSLSLNVWQNVCVIYDGTQAGTNNMKMYVNGAQVGSRDADAPDLLASAMPFYVGGDPIAGEYATARISQAMVYNRALTADEITTNFNALRNRYGI